MRLRSATMLTQQLQTGVRESIEPPFWTPINSYRNALAESWQNPSIDPLHLARHLAAGRVRRSIPSRRISASNAPDPGFTAVANDPLRNLGRVTTATPP